MSPHQLGDHREADPAARRAPGVSAPPEALEDMTQLVGGYSDAGVGDLQRRRVFLGAHLDPDRPAGSGELQSVGQQVGRNLVDAVGIAENSGRMQPHVEANAGRLELWGQLR
jgi:hypothetical protein